MDDVSRGQLSQILSDYGSKVDSSASLAEKYFHVSTLRDSN